MVPRMGKKTRKDGGPKIIVQILNSHSSREKWEPSASSRQSLQRERIRNGGPHITLLRKGNGPNGMRSGKTRESKEVTDSGSPRSTER